MHIKRRALRAPGRSDPLAARADGEPPASRTPSRSVSRCMSYARSATMTPMPTIDAEPYSDEVSLGMGKHLEQEAGYWLEAGRSGSRLNGRVV
eukprot:352906-Chlamydomonas_euryale.AAC.4